MFLTTKVQIGAALVGLGGANALAVTHFKEPLKDFFLNQNPIDLVNGQGLEGKNISLDLSPQSRQGLGVSQVSSSLGSPELSLKADQPSINLESLNAQSDSSGSFKAQVGSIRTELGLEGQIAEIIQEQKTKVERSKRDLQDKKSDFDSAVEKIKTFLSKDPKGPVRALNKKEKEALARAYKVWSATKQAEETALSRLERLGGERSRRRRSASSFRQDAEVASLLRNIQWFSDSIRFLNKDLAKKEENYGFGDWSSNPWSPFFEDQGEWLKTWSEREEIRTKIFKSWKDELNDQWLGGQCAPLYYSGEDTRNYCFEDMKTRTGRIFGEANIKIELLVGKKLLEWMNIPTASLTK
ncbi:hypothetical protein MHLP_03360 [Candidatus Mycoplasma haematolamae str. Purdue]|uniref:Uncharacterized protein n=1 Tax=Mycoplasma haematolamae (strain Purdue) TaxID=1212765 RepID=I7C6T6_MYCHA|nr:hypothetical protein [Candidatus Mycoplasma haematolamae]AFO52252.1 hypothetical protein MHLP_03360 [Candidatus Mycoplasma haematolamae str. Purdue]